VLVYEPVEVETSCKVGDEKENLQVRIVGPYFNAIEIYYHSSSQNRDEFARDELPGAMYLNCQANIFLAPQNPFGTFAVRFGHHNDTFKVYGWKKSETEPASYPGKNLGEGKPITLAAG